MLQATPAVAGLGELPKEADEEPTDLRDGDGHMGPVGRKNSVRAV